MWLETVNVVEYADTTILGMRSFVDNEEGNKEAEILFRTLLKENSTNLIEENEIKEFVDDGYYKCGDYQLFIVRSE